MKRNIIVMICSVLLIVFMLVGCAEKLQTNSLDDNTNMTQSDTDMDQSDVNTADATIDFNGSSATVSGVGATVNGGVVTITTAGTYLVSGTLSDGQLVVETTDIDKVYLVLNGADLTNKTGAPIYASQCEELIITLADGTTNILTDGGADFQYENTEDEEPNAALFCKDDLTINGTGTLTVNAGYNNGIVSKDNLLIEGGNLTVTAANHGLKGNDSVTILSGTFNVTADNDAIHSNGDITVDGGTFTIVSGDDGIHADEDLTVNDGSITVTDAYEGLEATNIFITGGEFDLTTSDDALNAAGGADQSDGGGKFGNDTFTEGGAYSINISGGNITLLAGGDGIDSNGTINISGGNIVSIIDSTPDNEALDSDGGITFTGGNIIYGGTGAGSAPDSNSTQSYVFMDSGITAGTEITVQKDDQTLMTYTPTTTLQYLAFSSPDITSGESYKLYSGSSLLSTVTAGEGGSGMMNGGPRDEGMMNGGPRDEGMMDGEPRDDGMMGDEPRNDELVDDEMGKGGPEQKPPQEQ